MTTEYFRWIEYTWRNPDLDPQKAETLTGGVDVGSLSSQALILADSQVFAFSNIRTGSDSPDSAKKAMDLALKEADLSLDRIQYVVGTGYGRVNVPFAARTITEIGCHARGANFFFPSARTILDMGGQDCKAIHCDERGKVTQFLMNDKCAAGTGRSMEVMAELLEVPITEVGERSLQVDKEPPPVSSTCVVFAKSEAMGLVRSGVSTNEVLAAYCDSMAHRVQNLLERIGMEEDFIITGGIAKNIGVVKRLEQRLGVEARIPFEPQIAGALGAAIFARDLFLKAQRAA